jgi:hypothetical protein
MFTRLRTTWFAGSGALVLVLALSGAVLGANVLTGASGPTPEEVFDPIAEVDTTGTFEDLDGDGVDDDCDEEVLADPVAEASAEAAVDTDGDGEVSVSEAAHSDRTGGKNCNHGGYVSQVAQDQCDGGTTDEAEELTEPTPTGEPVIEVALEPNDEDEPAEVDEEADEAEETADCDAEEDEVAEEAETEDAEACEEVAAPTFDPEALGEAGGFGRYVSSVAQSDAVGGKNCNHGGAVSEAVKAAKDAAREAREAAKAERAAERSAERAAAKAEREAQRAERQAAKAAKHGNGKGQGKGRGH